MLSKFTNVELVDNWSKGGQVYLDYISLMAMVDQQKGNVKGSFTPMVPKNIIGLPKMNTKKDVTRRLLDALPKMEKKEFLQGVAISEVARILGGFVLKNDDLVCLFSASFSFPFSLFLLPMHFVLLVHHEEIAFFSTIFIFRLFAR